MSDKHEVEELWEQFTDAVISPKVDLNDRGRGATCATTAIWLYRAKQAVRNGHQPADWVIEQIRMNMEILTGETCETK